MACIPGGGAIFQCSAFGVVPEGADSAERDSSPALREGAGLGENAEGSLETLCMEELSESAKVILSEERLVTHPTPVVLVRVAKKGVVGDGTWKRAQ